jgi:hypothetical protein
MDRRAAATATTAGATAISLGILDAFHLLPDPLATWMTIGLLVTYATCIAADRLIATGIRACDLVERIKAVRTQVRSAAPTPGDQQDRRPQRRRRRHG